MRCCCKDKQKALKMFVQNLFPKNRGFFRFYVSKKVKGLFCASGYGKKVYV